MSTKHSTSAHAVNATDKAGAVVVRDASAIEQMQLTGAYDVVCYGPDGLEKWRDTFHNLVTNVGKADLLDKYLAGSSYTATWYLGLINGGSAPTYNAADTAASHAGWTEITAYSESNRPAPSWNAATGTGGGSGTPGTGAKATTATTFSVNGTATVAGAFLISNNTKGGTTGVLFSAGNFTGGNKSVTSGDTLSVTYTANC
jgi:hypothetical protein